MTNESHFKALERMHEKANCNQAIAKDLKISISEGRAEITLPMRPDFYHAAEAVHGFVYFKMLDEAGFFAANSMVEDVFVLTSQYHCQLLRPIEAGVMRAVGTVVNATKTQIIADSVLYNEAGKELARGTGTFMRGRTPLDEKIGYVR
jgi:uncharacterized protein (TIGR00369 family)